MTIEMLGRIVAREERILKGDAMLNREELGALIEAAHAMLLAAELKATKPEAP